MKIPKAAMAMMVLNDAALAPMAEFIKFTASLLTPTTKSNMASRKRNTTIIIWFLQSFDTRLNVVDDSADSLLAMIGKFIAPIFKPLGFGDWRAVTALISGFTAKEAVVSTLSVLMNTGTAQLGSVLPSLFTGLSAVSFLVFTLLYTPCVAAVATIKKELGSRIKTVGVVFMQCAVAYIASFIVYSVGGLFV